MNKNSFFLLSICLCIFSCNHKSTNKEIICGDSCKYWYVDYDSTDNYNMCYKFYKNGTWGIYYIDKSGNIETEPPTDNVHDDHWDIIGDSIVFFFGTEYKIKHCNDSMIRLQSTEDHNVYYTLTVISMEIHQNKTNFRFKEWAHPKKWGRVRIKEN